MGPLTQFYPYELVRVLGMDYENWLLVAIS